MTTFQKGDTEVKKSTHYFWILKQISVLTFAAEVVACVSIALSCISNGLFLRCFGGFLVLACIVWLNVQTYLLAKHQISSGDVEKREENIRKMLDRREKEQRDFWENF